MSESQLPLVRTTESSDFDAANGETSAREVSSASTTTLIGQAAAPVTLAPPAPGETVVIAPQGGATYILDFAAREASVSAEGGNLVLGFDDTGDGEADRQIVFEDLEQLAEAGEAPILQIAGTSFEADILLNQALALNGEAAPLETAAGDGPDALGGGATVYNENLGELIALLQALGVIPPTELEFGLTDLEDDPDLILLGEALPTAPGLVINEIGLNVSLGALPGVPDLEPVDNLRLNFIELYNPEAGAVETLDLRVELLNPAGDVINISLPNGLVVPAGGFLVIYEQTFFLEAGPESLVTVAILDANETVVDTVVLPGVTPWLLGDDTTEALAVNLVFQAGTENETGVDTFAANLTAADLGVLSSPTWASNETVSELFPDANFETFFGWLTSGQNIFSRVFDNEENAPSSGAPLDSDTAADWTSNDDDTAGTLNDTDLTREGALVLNHGANPGVFHVGIDGSITEVVTEADVLAAGETDVAFINKGIALAPNGTVYFTNGGTGTGDGAIMQRLPDGTVEVLISEEAVAAAIPVGQVILQDLIVGDDGLLYVVDEENDAILSIDPETAAVSVLTSAADILGLAEFDMINDLGGLILSADGTTLYLAVDGDPNNGIVQIDIATGVPSVLATDADFNSLSVFMVLAPNGDLIVADESGGDELYRVTPGGNVSVFLSSVELDAVTNASTDLEAGFWFDADGNFYLADEQTQAVYRFDALDPVTGQVDPLGYPLALEADIIAALGAADLQGGAVFLPTNDINPSDPYFDDVNPQQANDNPLAGQTVQVADSDAGVLMEGFGGPDALFGGAGADTIYGGSQAMVAEQGALNDQNPGEAPVEGFSDHNDFLFGDAGDDALYGGSGGDFIIGGLDNDTVDGGTGNDRIFGHDAPIGGVPEGDPGTQGDNMDYLAGDGFNNLVDGDAATRSEAVMNLGGDDTVYGGFGADRLAGETIALNLTGDALGFAVNESEPGFLDPDGNDALFGGEGNDIAAGEVVAIGDDSVTGTAENSAFNFDTAQVGSDLIEGGNGVDYLAGETFAWSLSEDAEASADNESTGGRTGDDTLRGGEGGGDLAGEAMAFALLVATAIADNSAVGPASDAGNDVIVGGNAASSLAGEALAVSTGLNGTADADVDLVAEGSEAEAGNDELSGGAGGDRISGEAHVDSVNQSLAAIDITANAEGTAGGDVIAGGEGNDTMAGELQALAVGGSLNVGVTISADGEGSSAGDDTIEGQLGSASAAGEVLALASDNVTVTVTANATGGGSAASDTLSGDILSSDAQADTIAGDVYARSVNAATTVTVNNGELGVGADGNVGSDSILGGDGANVLAGDAIVEGADGTLVTINNEIGGSGFVGSDVILADNGDNDVAGDALLLGGAGVTQAVVNNTITSGGVNPDVGGDVVELGDGTNVVAGDVLGIGGLGLLATVNNLANDAGRSGSDRLTAGNGNNRIAGDALVVGGGVATVSNTNSAAVLDDASAGSDTIEAGGGTDTLSGDGMAFNGGSTVVNNSEGAGNDSITAGAGGDFIAGDGLADGAGGLANVNGGGDDTIDGGDDADLISGDGLGINGATADVTDGGDDLIFGGGGNDIIYGDSSHSDVNGGNDTINGGAGDDSIFGNSGDDELVGGTGADTLEGGDGNDSLTGNAGLDDLYGGQGNDTLDGGSDSDFLDGGDGADSLFGGAQNDILLGGVGNDTLDGGNQNDTLDGGDDDDTLTGGSGDDTFVFSSGATGTDTITDFNPDNEVIDLSDLLVGLVTENGADLQSYLQITFDGVDTTIGVDVDGVGGTFNDQTIVVQGQDLTNGLASQEDIINELLTNGALNADVA